LGSQFPKYLSLLIFLVSPSFILLRSRSSTRRISRSTICRLPLPFLSVNPSLVPTLCLVQNWRHWNDI